MYLRFVSPLREGRRGVYSGIFQAAFTCRDEVDMPAYLRRQLIEEIDWFKAHLHSPDDCHFRPRHSGQHRWESICWFKASARHMIARAWSLKACIEDAGMPICIRHTSDPGVITYEDDHQIVAYPRRGADIGFG